MTIKKDTIPLLISLLLVILSIGFKLGTYYELNYKHYIGIALVFISTALYLKRKKIYHYVFGITLFAGAVDIIDVFFINIRFSVGPIDFNPLLLLLLFLFLSFNKQFIDTIFPDKKPLTRFDLIKEQEKTELQVQNFERKFQNKTQSELNAILNKNNAYVNEARVAAERVMKKKYVL